jgi:hypothetical protein
MGRVQIPYPKTVETIALPFALEISNPYLGAFAGGLFISTVSCRESFLPDVTCCTGLIEAGFQRIGFIILPFSTIVTPEKA